eukprot:COSAG05_NODE_1067_length_5971_cov_450.254257_2_plen_66_part_00
MFCALQTQMAFADSGSDDEGSGGAPGRSPRGTRSAPLPGIGSAGPVEVPTLCNHPSWYSELFPSG